MVRLARFLRGRELRREGCELRRECGPSLARCLQGIRSARFGITAFAWAARTVELYAERAISGLMEVLLRRRGAPPDPRADR